MNDIAVLFRALADAQRIKILASTTDRGLTIEEIATATGQTPRFVHRQLHALREAGLIAAEGNNNPDAPITPDERYRFNQRPLFAALKALSPPREAVDLAEDTDAFDRKVLTDFIVDGRLKSIPAQQKKRDVVLRYLAGRFEEERMYPEREVNEILRAYHADVASLRRYLVDGEFLNRQIVREVEMAALGDGHSEVSHGIVYWKPRSTP